MEDCAVLGGRGEMIDLGVLYKRVKMSGRFRFVMGVWTFFKSFNPFFSSLSFQFSGS